jgi:hypothetical protein
VAKNLGLYAFLLFLYFGLGGCTKKADFDKVNTSKSDFVWTDDLAKADIPDFPVRGFLNGKSVQIEYTAYEIWRGTSDNVLNFSLVRPKQPCGYIDNYQGFQFLDKGGSITRGVWSKSRFGDESGTRQASFKYLAPDGNEYRSDESWNCYLDIENISPEKVIGKIAVCFNDKSKSWLAGRFEAMICNN